MNVRRWNGPSALPLLVKSILGALVWRLSSRPSKLALRLFHSASRFLWIQQILRPPGFERGEAGLPGFADFFFGPSRGNLFPELADANPELDPSDLVTLGVIEEFCFVGIG